MQYLDENGHSNVSVQCLATLASLKDPYKVKGKPIDSGEFKCLFTNLTYLGPKAESWIFKDSVHKAYDVLMAVETHLKGDKLKNIIQKLSKSSWIAKGSANPAKIGTSETGTSGGELTAAKNDIDSYPVHLKVLK